MLSPPTYFFVFEDEPTAKLFVERLAHYLKDLAILRDMNSVSVIDGSALGQREEILRLAKSSGAARVMIGDLSLTRS